MPKNILFTKSISFRQTRNCIAVAIILGLIISTIQLTIDYRNHQDEVNEMIQHVLTSADGPASLAAFNFDTVSGGYITQGLASFLPITNAEILLDTKEQIAITQSNRIEGVSNISRLFFGEKRVISIPLSMENRGDMINVGELIIEIDYARTGKAFIKRATLVFIFAGLKNVVFAVLLLLVFHQTITKSIVKLCLELRLKEEATRINMPKEHAEDELGILVSAFNESFETIRSQREKISGIVRNLELMVDERTNQLEDKNTELKLKNEVALNASRAKSDFLAMMSHELKTPLSAIQGLTQLLLLDDLTNEQRNKLDSIQFSCESLLSIVNNILGYSRLENKELKAEILDFNIRKLINSITFLFTAEATKKQIHLKVNVDSSVPQIVRGDAGKIRQVMINLIGNAIKFTEKGHIRINVTKDALDKTESILIYSVTDTGIGIAADNLDNIFESFSQADQSIRRDYGGTGVGLAICKKLTEGLGGVIGVDSVLNEYSHFWFSMPFEIGEEKYSYTGNKRKTILIEPLRILVVEDNIILQTVTCSMLELHGHKLTRASNGVEAIKILEQTKVDVILMDIQMPRLDGFETTKVIRNHEDRSIRDIPVIALTVNANDENQGKCKVYGMNDMVAKPLTMNSIARAISTSCGVKILSEVDISNCIVHKSVYLDEEIVHNNLSSLGKDRFRAILSKAYVSIKDKLNLINELYKSKDYKLISAEAHSLAGLAGGIGFTIVSEMAMAVEEKPEQGSLKEVEELIHNIERVLNISQKVLGRDIQLN